MSKFEWDEPEIEYPADAYDDGYADSASVPCVRCGAIITAELDRGEPQTFEHPGTPPEWYVTPENECACMASYTAAEATAFHDACDREAQSTPR